MIAVLAALSLLVASPILAAPKLHPATVGSVEIDQVEMSGITLFGRTEVESALELTAGDELEQAKVVRTAANLAALYRARGYDEASVRSELVRGRDEQGRPQTILRFVVGEGLPTRIAAVKLVPTSARARSFLAQWRRIELELLAKAGIAAGDISDQERIIASRRALTEALASEEYIGAKVSDVKVVAAEKPVEAPFPAARWITLEYQLDLGDRVTFGFRDNTVFNRTRLLSVIEEQRTVGFGKDYISAIRERLSETYRSAGYAHVHIRPFTFENPERQERHITFVFHEGPRVSIKSIDFDGNSVFTREQLHEEFMSRASDLIQRGYYVDREIEKGAELLIEWLKSRGYLAAKLVTINRTVVPGQTSAKIVIYLYEGEQTRVSSVDVSGLAAFNATELRRLLGILEGQPLNLFAFNEGLEVLKTAYRDRGYLDIRVLNEGEDSVVRYSRENRAAGINLVLAEGPRYRVGRIEIEGLSGTRELVVRRELVFKEEEVLEEFRITESEARLRKLGIFAGVNIRTVTDDSRPGFKIVRVSVQEGTPGIIAGGVGYRNDLGVRVFGQTAYSNLWHRNHTLSLTGNVNHRFGDDFCGPDRGGKCFFEYGVQLGYVYPWFALGETTFRPRLTAEKIRYIKFDASTVAVAAAWERTLYSLGAVGGRLMPLLGPRLALIGGFTYSLERSQQYNALTRIDNQTLTIGAITPTIRLDMRDSSLAPTRGLFSQISYEVCDPLLFSKGEFAPVGFTRFQFRADYFVPVAREVTWYLSFRTGIERNTQRPPADDPDNLNYAIPLIKQFTLGGAGSLRGFREQELNLQDLALRGTASFVNYRTQLDLPFAGPLRFGPFLDAANLLVDSYSFGTLRFGVGVGLHYQSPVGPVNFDWGFKVSPKPGEEPQRFYFSIGVI